MNESASRIVRISEKNYERLRTLGQQVLGYCPDRTFWSMNRVVGVALTLAEQALQAQKNGGNSFLPSAHDDESPE